MPKFFNADSDELAFGAATLAYKEELSQSQIAGRLGLSAMQVSRLIRQAHEKGFVKAPVLEAPTNFALSGELLRLLPKLRRVKVAFTLEAFTDASRIQAAASAAAQLWQNELRNFDAPLMTGIGGGRAIAALVDGVILPKQHQLEFLSLANIAFGDWECSADTNVAVLKRRFPDNPIKIRPLGAFRYDPSMAEPEVERERRRLSSLSRVKRHMQDFTRCRLVFSGVGSFADDHTRKLIDAMHLPGKILTDLVTGDLSYNLIYHDARVFHDDCPMRARLLSVDLTSLKDIAATEGSLVAIVAWGAMKAKPILDAYRAGVFNAMAIEMALANEIIRLVQSGYLTLSQHTK